METSAAHEGKKVQSWIEKRLLRLLEARPLSQAVLDANRYAPSTAFLRRGGASPADVDFKNLPDTACVLSHPPHWRG